MIFTPVRVPTNLAPPTVVTREDGAGWIGTLGESLGGYALVYPVELLNRTVDDIIEVDHPARLEDLRAV